MSHERPRQASVRVTYQRQAEVEEQPEEGTEKESEENDIIEQYPAEVMAEYNEGFTYTDTASGESDTIDITLTNIDLCWLDQWMPQKGDKLAAEIVTESWDSPGEEQVFDCGRFCLDDLTYTGPELTCTISGVSVPECNAFRSTGRSKTWKEVTLSEVAQEIAAKYYLELEYAGDTIKLGTIEQDNESDSSFLKKLCQDYGMAVKIYSGKIIVYDKGSLEDMEPIATLKPEDLQNWTYNTTLVGTYTSATIQYTSGKDDKVTKCTVGDGKRILNINEKVESLQEAQTKACAKINAENEKAETMSMTIMADCRIAAGSTICIEGLYQIDGKYFVDKVTHSIGPDKAYTMDIDLHKCQERIKDAEVLEEYQGQEQTDAVEAPDAPDLPDIKFAAGDKVIVNGPAYWGSNGGKANHCSNRTMYIVQYKQESTYPYGVAVHRDGTRYGWCAEGSLQKA